MQVGYANRVREITEGTLIPISLVIVLTGGIYWFSSMYSQVQEHSVRLTALEDKQAKTLDMMYNMKEDVAVIRAVLAPRKGK